MRIQPEENNIEIKFSLVMWISFFLHVILVVSIVLQHSDPSSPILTRRQQQGREGLPTRDIIVNLNQDNRRVYNRTTLLSDKDSSAQGYVTKVKGNRWLNNSLEFMLQRGKKSSRSSSSREKSEDKILLSRDNEVVVFLAKYFMGEPDTAGQGGSSDFTRIPDRNDVTRRNAIYYSNTGHFSFNTKKFKNFHYFKKMKDKIASNWYPPMVANAIMGGYAPGSVRIMAIQSQEVKLYFVLNRAGDVVKVRILDSMGNSSLDSSCVDAIRMSKTFGPVPDDIGGNLVVIPFIFGYYVQ